MAAEPLIVQALYSFKGTNNDELCFKKGDLITVTQKDEGWWEGTLNGKTGWFPSNYVKELKDACRPSLGEQNQYKSFVLKDLIDSERAHVVELEGLVNNFLQPLEKNGTLSIDEYRQLTANITEVLETHQQLLKLLESEEMKPGPEQRVGKLFLTWAVKIKSVHQKYCSLHPKAVLILDKYRDELMKYMELRGAASPGILVLTTLLSKPFRRLEKYAGMLQELERHIEECHPDRGDTQRSVAVYKDIAATCSATRKQKELELQVLTGPVRGWEGCSLSSLGDIIYMNSVAVGPQHQDRYFVLFPSTLLILSVSHRLSAFIYEGQLPLAGINVTRLEDNDQYKNAFEVSTAMTDKMIAVCQSKEDADRWVELIRKQMTGSCLTSSTLSLQSHFPPQPPPHMNPQVTSLRPATTSSLREAGSTLTASIHSTHSIHSINLNRENKGWSAVCLRPASPLRPCLALGNPNGLYTRSANRRNISYKEDGLILDVIEGYCNMAKPRSMVNSVELWNINGNKGESDKKLSSDIDQAVKNKVNILHENLLHLQIQMNDEITARCELQNMVQEHLSSLQTQFKEEKIARCALQTIIKNYIAAKSKDYEESIEWPTLESDI